MDRLSNAYTMVGDLFRRCYDRADGRRRMQDSDTKVQFILARGWLIERARSKKLREQLDAYHDWVSHWEFCDVGDHRDESKCSCGLYELNRRFKA